MHVPEQCRGGGRVQKCGAKGGGGDVSQKKGDGEVRENDLESFHSFRRITKSPVGTSPKDATSLTRDSAGPLCYFSHSSPPTSSDYFPRQCTSNGKVLFFLSLPPDRSPFLTGAQGPPLVQT